MSEAQEPETQDTMTAALLREREGYVQRGMKDRVAQVDEQLKLRGYKPQRGRQQKPPAEQKAAETEQQKAEQEQRSEPPKGRQQPASDKA
ncbi:hypothetical protein [Streptomyces gilvus]|uniref:hypothetical protein n=1 Tax=Streptomyces gilvus TaxID=2920937 RepID=UPI001F0DB87B|nr:hypothetical protein [Streptomyces sp. CME 23]MCH5677834.1 hypothetical protein [Streptomyces sp. CME 23]